MLSLLSPHKVLRKFPGTVWAFAPNSRQLISVNHAALLDDSWGTPPAGADPAATLSTTHCQARQGAVDTLE